MRCRFFYLVYISYYSFILNMPVKKRKSQKRDNRGRKTQLKKKTTKTGGKNTKPQ